MDVRPPKGQLRDYQLDLDTNNYPVVMPEENWISFPSSKARSVWALTHENELGFDLTVDQALLNQMEEEALTYYQN